MTTRRMLTLGVVLGLLLGAVVVLAALRSAPSRTVEVAPDRGAPVDRGQVGARAEAVGAEPLPRPSALRALAVLTAWSERRSRAWAAGSPEQVRALYASARAARAELAIWQAYRRRGLRVEGLRSQVVAIRVLSEQPGRIALLVDERSAGGRIVGDGVPHQVALPQDGVDRRRVVLVHGADAGWQVARVSARDRPR
ncbi:hypothetical protein NODU109028_06230 [Nocardioides dubius]|uniref:Mce-associated membrane protein n=1 Tax=Nocardioides dubius TaxID=317019 RepID=A0ABN1TPG9_9ACTN